MRETATSKMQDANVETNINSDEDSFSNELLKERNERLQLFVDQMKNRSLSQQGRLFSAYMLELNEELTFLMRESRDMLSNISTSSTERTFTDKIQRVIAHQDIGQAYVSLIDDCARHFLSYIKQSEDGP